MSFPLPLHAPNHVTRKGRNFVNGAERWLPGRKKLRPFPEAANLLAERCGVSNKQQWAGNTRDVIGCGENLAGAYPEAPPLPGYPGYRPALAAEVFGNCCSRYRGWVIPGMLGGGTPSLLAPCLIAPSDCTPEPLSGLENPTVPGTPLWSR